MLSIRQPTLLPDRLYVKLRYRESLSWSQTSGSLGDNVYRANSIFDPDLTGSGGQAMGLDQWQAFYSYYTVLGCGIEVTSMMNGGPGSTQRHGVTPTITSTAFATGDAERAEELPYTKAVTPHAVGGTAAAAVGNSVIKAYMSTAKINGAVRDAIQIEDGYTALYNQNPTFPWFWHVWNYVPGGETQSLYQNVVLTFYVVFSGRTTMVVS